MSRIKKLNKLQESFVSEFIEKKGRIIFEVCTGFGNVLI
jgi:hypothetical protein